MQEDNILIEEFGINTKKWIIPRRGQLETELHDIKENEKIAIKFINTDEFIYTKKQI